jgi:hypothetical protein
MIAMLAILIATKSRRMACKSFVPSSSIAPPRLEAALSKLASNLRDSEDCRQEMA